jgi:transcription antitermination factor NusG
MAHGCLFCLTGKELIVANLVENADAQIRARAVRKVVRHTKRGVTTLQDDIVLKGYVFFEAPESINIFTVMPQGESMSVLTDSDGDWRLYGDDESYAKWVLKYDGLFGLSKAYKVGDRICITDGPLKDLEGQITRIDKRNQSGQITVPFAGRQQKIWLGFNIVKELPAND